MLNTKLNLYNPEWIELYSNRNKSYGAYELRRHYGHYHGKSYANCFTTIVVAAILYTYIVGKTPGVITKTVEYIIPDIQPPKIDLPKKVEPPMKPSAPEKQMAPVKTTQFITPVPTSAPVTIDPPKITDLDGNVGPKTIEGKDGVAPIVDPVPTTGGAGTAPAEDNTIHNIGGLEFMPEPIGGTSAWVKFLSKNLRFPAQAQEAGKGGRVFVTFVIEKDGRLSDFSVQKGAGYGMDEEALRVLKLAKPWKPGMQNGQPVRVRYVIPLNFQINEQQ
jgi:protein TonB